MQALALLWDQLQVPRRAVAADRKGAARLDTREHADQSLGDRIRLEDLLRDRLLGHARWREILERAMGGSGDRLRMGFQLIRDVLGKAGEVFVQDPMARQEDVEPFDIGDRP